MVFISQRLNDDDLLTSRVWQKSTESSSFVVSALSLWAAVNLIPWIFIQHIILTNFNPLNTGDVNVNVQLKTYNNEDWMNLFYIILHSIPTALFVWDVSKHNQVPARDILAPDSALKYGW